MPSRSPLCTIPHEILDNIAFELACSPPLGPPSDLIPLLATCRHINSSLAFADHPTLYARIFREKFDDGAVRRRAFDPTSSRYAAQLVHYSTALQVIRSGNINHFDVEDAMLTAYMMMLENDGKNRAQLEHAGLESFVDRFVRTRMYHGRHANDGWPQDNPSNACALWLMWMTTTEQKLLAESEAQRQQIIQIVLPYVLAPFRYAQAQAPPNHFALPLPVSPVTHTVATISIPTPHGHYPIYPTSLGTCSQVHYASRTLLSTPPITPAAKLIYFSRREIVPFGIPPHLPLTRAEAHQRGNFEITPTQEDVREFNKYKDSRFIERGRRWDWWNEKDAKGKGKAPSEAWDDDWWRLRMCGDVFKQEKVPRLGCVYTPGSMEGLWQGRILIPGEAHISALLSNPHFPPAFSEAMLNVITQPVYMRLHEHHCVVPARPIPCGGQEPGLEDGLANAWFPGVPGTLRHSKVDGGKKVNVKVGAKEYEYESYAARNGEGSSRRCHGGCEQCTFENMFKSVGLESEGEDEGDWQDEEDADAEGGDDEVVDSDGRALSPLPKDYDPLRVKNASASCDGVRDIIFTGATDERHGQAWNHFEFYGRVRPWDGLIGILRKPRDSHLGYIFVYGYLNGNQNFVGNWRIGSADPVAPAWESAFTMSRREDE